MMTLAEAAVLPPAIPIDLSPHYSPLIAALFIAAILLVSVAFALGRGGSLPGDGEDPTDMQDWRW